MFSRALSRVLSRSSMQRQMQMQCTPVNVSSIKSFHYRPVIFGGYRYLTTSSTSGGKSSPQSSNDSSVDDTDKALTAVLEDVKRRVVELQKMGVDLSKIEGVKMPGPKMLLQFTCDYHGPKANSENGCNHKSTKIISKNSYETGVVLVRCERCDNLHLIADNKGFFDDKSVNIESIMRDKGEVVKRMLVDDSLDIA
eukprot:g2664.t1